MTGDAAYKQSIAFLLSLHGFGLVGGWGLVVVFFLTWV